MFLFEKRAFLPACGPLPFNACLTWTTSRFCSGTSVPHRHNRSMCLCPYLGDESPPRNCYLTIRLPGVTAACQFKRTCTPCLYLALTRFIAPKPPTARARLLTALVFCSSLRYFLLVRVASLLFGDLWPTPLILNFLIV